MQVATDWKVEAKLTAFVGFDPGQKQLAGCYVSIGHDGTPCFDKGLVKPEHESYWPSCSNGR